MQSRRQRERERPFCCSQLLCIRNHNQVQSHRISIILLNCSSPTPPSTPIAACHVNNKYDSDTFISYPAEFHFIPLFPLNVPRSFFCSPANTLPTATIHQPIFSAILREGDAYSRDGEFVKYFVEPSTRYQTTRITAIRVCAPAPACSCSSCKLMIDDRRIRRAHWRNQCESDPKSFPPCPAAGPPRNAPCDRQYRCRLMVEGAPPNPSTNRRGSTEVKYDRSIDVDRHTDDQRQHSSTNLSSLHTHTPCAAVY